MRRLYDIYQVRSCQGKLINKLWQLDCSLNGAYRHIERALSMGCASVGGLHYSKEVGAPFCQAAFEVREREEQVKEPSINTPLNTVEQRAAYRAQIIQFAKEQMAQGKMIY